MKRTYQPSRIKRKRTHGFRKRMSTPNGRNVIKRRRQKGRKILAPVIPQKWLNVSGTVRRNSFSSKKFPRERRLLHRGEFLRVEKSGKRFRGKYLTISLARSDNDLTRLGLVVSRKVGCAVVRNRLKRLSREYFRNHYDQLPPGVDMVVIVRKGFPELLDFFFFTREIKKLTADFEWT